MNSLTKKIRKPKKGSEIKHKLQTTRTVFIRIFTYISQNERLQYRFVCRKFNILVIQSITQLNFESSSIKMKTLKVLLSKCVNLKQLSYPSLYKPVQMTSLLGKNFRPKLLEITHIRFRSYEDLVQLILAQPQLKTIEIYFDFKGNHQQLTENQKQILLNSSIEEIIINREDYELDVIDLLKNKIKSLKISVSANVQLDLMLIAIRSIELNLNKLFIKFTTNGNNEIFHLNELLYQQVNLEMLYLDIYNAVDLSKNEKLQTLIIENMQSLRTLQLPTNPINKFIIKSYAIFQKDIRLLFKQFDHFNHLDISGTQGCWIEILLKKNKLEVPHQQNKKQLIVYLNQNTFEKLQELTQPQNISLQQLEPIENLQNYY